MFDWRITTACLLVAGQAAADDRIGDDRHRYEPLPLVDCSEADQLGLFVGSDRCLLVSGAVRWAGAYDSSAGFLTQHTELLSAVAVESTDIGPAFAVITLQNDGTWSLDNTYTQPDETKLYEAYVAIGDDVRLTAGRAPTILETGGDEPLDWIAKQSGRYVEFPLASDGTYPLTSDSIQVSAALTESLVVAAGIEDGTSSLYLVTKPRAVGVVRYDDGQTSAHVSVAGFGVLEGEASHWAAHSAVNSSLGDAVRVAAAASFESFSWGHFTHQRYDAMLSVALDIDPIEVAITVQQLNWWNETLQVSGSVTTSVADGLRLRAGVLSSRSDYDWQDYYAAGVTIDLSEAIAIGLSGGHVRSEWDILSYAAAELDLHLESVGKAKARAVITDDAGYKIESEFFRTFH